jgi:hypothetical protein
MSEMGRILKDETYDTPTGAGSKAAAPAGAVVGIAYVARDVPTSSERRNHRVRCTEICILKVVKSRKLMY